jgi:hypothetical protein
MKTILPLMFIKVNFWLQEFVTPKQYRLCGKGYENAIPHTHEMDSTKVTN